VTNVDCSLEDQKIKVTHSDAATPADMLAALEKWAAAAGKKVSLAE
jgi:hypothetical protein